MTSKKPDFPAGTVRYFSIFLASVCMCMLSLLFPSHYARAITAALSIVVSFYCWGKLYLIGWPPTVIQALKIADGKGEIKPGDKRIISFSFLRWLFWDNVSGTQFLGWMLIVLVYLVFEIFEIIN